jgi:hypothetical protein
MKFPPLLRPVLIGLSLVGILSSCVSTKNIAISTSDRAALKGKTVAVPNHKMPGWGVLKPETAVAAGLGGAIGGAIAGGVAEQQGNKEIKKHNIKDPAEKVAEVLESQLVQQAGAKRITGSRPFVDKNDAKEVAGLVPGADYILDVRSMGWMGIYYPMTLTKYRVIHNMQMRLIEQKTGRVVAQGFSAYQSDDKANAPNFDGIYANGAAFLKQELKSSSDRATVLFKSQL